MIFECQFPELSLDGSLLGRVGFDGSDRFTGLPLPFGYPVRLVDQNTAITLEVVGLLGRLHELGLDRREDGELLHQTPDVAASELLGQIGHVGRQRALEQAQLLGVGLGLQPCLKLDLGRSGIGHLHDLGVFPEQMGQFRLGGRPGAQHSTHEVGDILVPGILGHMTERFVEDSLHPGIHFGQVFLG